MPNQQNRKKHVRDPSKEWNMLVIDWTPWIDILSEREDKTEE